MFNLLDAKTPEEAFHKLCELDIDNLSREKILEFLSILVDLSLDLLNPDGLDLAEVWAKKLFGKKLSSEQRSTLNYFSANIWANRRIIKSSQTNETSRESQWNWDQVEFEKEIFCLRSAVNEEAFLSLNSTRKCQILTNLANLYNTIGRFISAMEFWERALKIQPSFGMALGNRGAGRIHYGNILYDIEQRERFLACAREDLEAALKIELHPNARTRYVQLLEQLSHENRTSIQTENSTKVEETLVSKEIEAYKKWCLNKRLFLNPMNDLSHAKSAAQDIVTAPSIIYALDKAPIYHGFFNQLKQEFVGARFLLYEGVIATEPHFSDRDVLLYNTLDYPVYSLHSEKVRIAFRVAYSLLDKIAYFLNSYLSLGIPERQVNIRTMWYVNREKKKGLRKVFNARANWPLRGLFWLTKDLFEDKEGFREVTEPDSQQLAEIRNHLEHKYLKLHSEYWPRLEPKTEFANQFRDSLAMSFNILEFQPKAIRLLRLVREALIYLALAVHVEESTRLERYSGLKIMPMQLGEYRDEWKV